MMVPLIASYMDMNLKNDDLLIKMLAIVQKGMGRGKETGDYSDLGQIGLDTIAGAINPALLFGTYMKGAGEGEAEELAKERYKGMVGGGRGIAPPSPRSQVGRR